MLKDDTRGFLSEQLDSVMLPPLNVSRLDWLAGRVSFRDCVHGASTENRGYMVVQQKEENKGGGSATC